jgi:hypothetical protein
MPAGSASPTKRGPAMTKRRAALPVVRGPIDAKTRVHMSISEST